MDKSEKLDNLAKALSKVQSRLKGAKQDSLNPFFKSKYADLFSVWEACRDLLAENELAIIQTTSIGENHQLIVETTLLHSSGEWVTGKIPMILAKQDPQGIGSAITYGRRYGLSAIVGICPEDDDAESAMGRDKKPSPKEVKSETKAPEVIQKTKSPSTVDADEVVASEATVSDAKSLMEWVFPHGKQYNPTWVRQQANIEPNAIITDEMAIEAYKAIKALMGWS